MFEGWNLSRVALHILPQCLWPHPMKKYSITYRAVLLNASARPDTMDTPRRDDPTNACQKFYVLLIALSHVWHVTSWNSGSQPCQTTRRVSNCKFQVCLREAETWHRLLYRHFKRNRGVEIMDKHGSVVHIHQGSASRNMNEGSRCGPCFG